MEIPEQASPIRKQRSMEFQQIDDNQFEKQYIKLPPLGLNKEQLMERLETLKDYPTFKQTKAKRINLKVIAQHNQSPLVSCALRYGSREGKNEVLEEFINSHNSKPKDTETLNRFQQLMEQNKHKRIKPKLSNADPSFINYKSTEERQMPKINKMVSSAHLNTKEKKRSKTQVPERYTLKRSKIFPKELAKMKKGLKRLPVLEKSQDLRQLNYSESKRYNPQNFDAKASISIESNLNKDLTLQSRLSPQKSSILNNSQASSLETRQDYINCLKTILQKSTSLLSNQPTGTSLDNSSYSQSQQTQEQEVIQMIPLRKKKIRYWPSYAQYSISKADQKRLNNLAKISTSILLEQSDIVQPVRQLDDLIKDELKHEENRIIKDFLHNENNNLGNKFNYLIDLEQERYKKTAKQLTKLKKQFYLQRTREQIRANGIKRVKNFKTTSGKKIIMEADAKYDD